MTRSIIILAATESKIAWDARYLMAISQLNFDHELHMICLPGAVETCHWDDKQWNALTIYGLASCHHIDTAPPIDSTLVDWNLARTMVDEHHPVLHLYHWQNMTHFHQWLPLVSSHDVLLVIGQVDAHDISQIQTQFPWLLFHVVNSSQQPHIKPHETQHINHQQWARLIQQHQTVLTWN